MEILFCLFVGVIIYLVPAPEHMEDDATWRRREEEGEKLKK